VPALSTDQMHVVSQRPEFTLPRTPTVDDSAVEHTQDSHGARIRARTCGGSLRLMRAAVTFHGCHRRGGVERVMLESVNFLAGRGDEVHAFAGSWDVPAIHEGVIRHNLSFPRSPQVLALPAYKRASARAIASMQIPPDVVAGFG